MSPAPLALTLVTDRRTAVLPPLRALALALPVLARHGLAPRTVVLIREKDLDDDALADLSGQVLEIAGEFDVAVRVAGRPEVAQQLGVGVHLGEADPLPSLVRRQLGPATTITRALHASTPPLPDEDRLAVDGFYAAPVFPTRSKPGAETLGLEGLRRLVATAGRPVHALGGIEGPDVLPGLAATGISGIAVRHALLGVEDPAAAARLFAAALAG